LYGIKIVEGLKIKRQQTCDLILSDHGETLTTDDECNYHLKYSHTFLKYSSQGGANRRNCFHV